MTFSSKLIEYRVCYHMGGGNKPSFRNCFLQELFSVMIKVSESIVILDGDDSLQ